MKIAIASVIVLGACAFGIPALTQSHGANGLPQERPSDRHDADKLYALVREARNELREMRVRAGLHPPQTARTSTRRATTPMTPRLNGAVSAAKNLATRRAGEKAPTRAVSEVSMAG